jgi:hypothetical protein
VKPLIVGGTLSVAFTWAALGLKSAENSCARLDVSFSRPACAAALGLALVAVHRV